jgi:PAS domain S-box-containing protein
MRNLNKTKSQLLNELAKMRRRVDGLEKSEAERKQEEERLHEIEEMFRLFMEHSPIYVFFKDEQIRSTHLSKNYEQMLGRPLHELTGKTMDDLFPSELAKSMVQDDLRILRERKPIEVEEELNGRYYTTTKFPITREGKPPLLAGFTMDITERKSAEEALREYERVIENSRDMIAVVDQDYKYVLANSRFLKYRVLNREQVIGRSVRDVVGGEVFEKVVKKNVDACFQGEAVHFEMKHVYPELGERDLLVRYFPVENPEGTRRIVSIIQDITERKRAEEILHLYRLLSEHSRDIILSIRGGGGRILEANAAAAKAYGYSHAELLGLTIHDLRAIDTRGVTTDQMAKADTEGILFETIHQRKDSSTFPVEVSSQGATIGGTRTLISVIRDITERKRLEEKGRELEERLRRAEKMEALGTLAGGVAHDLNDVLGVLVGYSELLLMEIAEGNPLRKHVSNILKSSQRSAAIIQDLLTLARRGVMVSEVLNLNHVISDYFTTPEFEKLKAYHPRVTFKSELDKDLMNIKGSTVRLNKKIMNLLSNAAEAISDHGEVILLTENRYLDRPIAGYDDIREGDYVVLKVSDNGKGISTEDLGKIFEPFYTKKVMGKSGTGLGLAVVWGAVKDHHGYIDVRSEKGKGSIFTLYFPVSREDIISDQKVVSTESYKSRGESILVVDDVKEQRELATAILSGLGYRVSAVSSGEEAVTYLMTNRVHLLVLDMIMDPGMDGLETYQKVLEINPMQKAIIVSGFSETDRVKKAHALGAGAYVQKPYIREKIGLAIRRELDK